MTHSDVLELVALADEFYDSGDYWGERRELDKEALAECLHAEIQNPQVFALTALKDGRVVGCIVMVLAPDPFLGGMMACKLQWISDPEHGRGTGLELMRLAEQWAKDCGAGRIINGGMSDRVCKLLERERYTPLEKHYEKRL